MVSPSRARAVIVAAVCFAAPLPVLASPPPPCDATSCAAIEGEVRRAGDRKVVAGARVFVLPADPEAPLGRVRAPMEIEDEPAWLRTGETDAEGRFDVADVPLGRVRIVVVADEHERTEWIIEAPGAKGRRAKLWVRPRGTPYRTVVESRPETGEMTPTAEHTLEREEIDTVPGSQGDALRSLQNLPGVTRTAAGLGDPILRGSPPGQTVVYVGTQRVPRAFHLIGISSVIPSAAVESISLVPGNYDAAYGNVTGGLIHIVPRVGRTDGHHGHAELDLGGVAGMAEGPMDRRRRWSYLLGLQRSHLDLVARGVRSVDPNANLAEPSYWDYQAFFDRRVGGSELGVHVLGAWDRLTFHNPYVDGDSHFKVGFHRIDFTTRQRVRGLSFLFTPGFRFDTTRIQAPLSDTDNRRYDWVVTLRSEIQKDLRKGLRARLGTDLEFDVYDFRPESRTYPPPQRDTGLQTTVSVYGNLEIRIRSVTLEPGVRASVFNLKGITERAVDPRASVRWQVTRMLEWRFGLGVYSALSATGNSVRPDVLESSGTTPDGGLVLLPPALVDIFNRATRFQSNDVALGRAIHASTGLRVKLPREFELEATGYLRRRTGQSDLLAEPSDIALARVWNWSWGGEFLARKRLTRGLYGWVAYTLMWARDIRPEQPGGREPYDRPGEYDQRHNIVAVISSTLPRNWRIGARFRVATGLPYTPVVGSYYDVSSERFIPVLGEPLSARFPMFHQLDLRVDKRFYGRYASVLLYLDIQNVYNNANAEAFVYSADYARRAGALGLPIFPSLGLRVEY